ncbi:MAG TPA: carboxypeptidase-like regulatory domain-containing protein [Candidatus Manganitrophaceae bacterium]|nr:carboxypeptidase-like regulatory domain-containing protein [Candidatus Manganitrophaceae bacterium]
MKKSSLLAMGLFWVGALAMFTGVAFGYEEMNVEDGGSINGKVKLKGAIPEPRVFPLVLYPFGPFCKKISDGQGNIRLEEFAVSSDGGMQDAIVAVQRVKKGKPFPHIKNELVAVDCMFHPADVPSSEQFSTAPGGKLRHEHPLVMVLENHRPISVVNKDPIIHNGQVFQNERGNIILNFPLPVSTEPRGGVLHFKSGKRISQMICGMHEFMQSWGFVVDNPYYAKTKKGGEFVIDQLPPGTYKLTAWHPHLKPIEQEVTVSANGAVTVDFEFDSSQVVRPQYESQEKFRVGPEARPHDHLESCEAPYC